MKNCCPSVINLFAVLSRCRYVFAQILPSLIIKVVMNVVLFICLIMRVLNKGCRMGSCCCVARVALSL